MKRPIQIIVEHDLWEAFKQLVFVQGKRLQWTIEEVFRQYMKENEPK